MPWPGLVALAQGAMNAAGAAVQTAQNMKIAKFQAAANQRLLQQQLDYDSPKSQMARFQEAGLNPSLMYSQGNVGNQGSPLSYPAIQPGDYQSAFSNVVPSYQQARLADSQVQANSAKVMLSKSATQVNRLKALVLEQNPLLNEKAFDAIINSFVDSARIKSEQATQAGMMTRYQDVAQGLGVNKMNIEMTLLSQKWRLGDLDEKIKVQILNSKEFENDLLEVQKKFMADGEVGPAQIMDFVKLFLQSFLRKK